MKYMKHQNIKKHFVRLYGAIAALALVALVAAFIVSIPSSSAASFYVTNLPTSHTSTTFSAHYQVTTAAPEKVSFYAWVGEYIGRYAGWKQDILLTSMDPSTALPLNFGVDFDYATYGMVPGKVYAYAVADRTTNDQGTVFFATPGTDIFRCFTVTDGEVPCSTASSSANTGTSTSTGTTAGSPGTSSVDPNHFDAILTDKGQTPYTGHVGRYVESFDLQPNGKPTVAIDTYLKLYKNTNTSVAPLVSVKATFPKGSADSVQSVVYNLAPGPYIAGLFMGTKRLGAWETFLVKDSASDTQNGLTYTLTADGAAYTSNADDTKYSQTMTAVPSAAPTTSTDVTIKVFHGSDLNTPSATATITFPAGLTAGVGALLDKLDKGSYIAAVYSGSKVVSKSVIFDVIEGDGSVKPGTTLGTPDGSSSGSSGSGAVDMSGNNANNGNPGAGKPDGSKPGDQGTDEPLPKTFLKNPLAAGLDTFPKILAAVINNIILPVAVPFLVIMIVYSGFLFVTARKTGSVSDLDKAKQTLKYTLIGAALILGAFVIANALQATVKDLLGPTTTT